MSTNLMNYLCLIYFINQPLNVLGMFVAHHQEVFTVYVQHVPTAVQHVPTAVQHVPTAVQHVPTAVQHVPTAVQHVPTAVHTQ
jgi:hypothetical protein